MKHTDTPIKAFKVTDQNMQCRGFQFKIGKEYQSDNPVRCGKSGFHSCLMAVDCFNYYNFDSKNRVFEVEIWGDYEDDYRDTKLSSQYIRLIRELSWLEVLEIVNTGHGNTGHGNTGDGNTGDRNSGHGNTGDGNSGDWNSGDWNSGNRNSGNRNSGDRNSGDRNSGNRNSGDRNSGDRNSGSYNSTNFSSGYFNSQEADVYMFNKPTGKKRSEIDIPYINILLTEWIEYTDEEKKSDPQKALMGGYLREYSYKEAWANWYETATQRQIDKIKALPNYDADVFYEITGLKI